VASGGAGALLVSPFTMEWGCYARAGGVEELGFCLFVVVFPARCISSISPRFYFRNHAFCFLPLVTILESEFLSTCLGQQVVSGQASPPSEHLPSQEVFKAAHPEALIADVRNSPDGTYIRCTLHPKL
jgi:hypothetical protein